MKLEIALRDQPFGAEIADDAGGIEGIRQDPAVDRRDAVDLAGEAALHEPGRHRAHVAGMSGVDVANGRAVEKGLPAGRHAHRGRHVDQLEHSGGIEAPELADGERRADHPVSAK